MLFSFNDVFIIVWEGALSQLLSFLGDLYGYFTR